MSAAEHLGQLPVQLLEISLLVEHRDDDRRDMRARSRREQLPIAKAGGGDPTFEQQWFHDSLDLIFHAATREFRTVPAGAPLA